MARIFGEGEGREYCTSVTERPLFAEKFAGELFYEAWD